MKRTVLSILAIALVCAAVPLTILAIVNAYNRETDAAYAQATSLVAAGEYSGALELLEGISNKSYHDTRYLINICEAHKSYENGDLQTAYSQVRAIVLRDYDGVSEDELTAFYDGVVEEYRQQQEAEALREQREYRNRIANGVPYVGMPESEIANTSLGKPEDRIGHNNACISGEQYRANIYYFRSGGKLIFSARCIRGKVSEVWDYRDNPQSYSYSGGHHSSGDPYDVDDYQDAEEFYYYNYNDFIDYEDAEDYYNDHCG